MTLIKYFPPKSDNYNHTSRNGSEGEHRERQKVISPPPSVPKLIHQEFKYIDNPLLQSDHGAAKSESRVASYGSHSEYNGSYFADEDLTSRNRRQNTTEQSTHLIPDKQRAEFFGLGSQFDSVKRSSPTVARDEEIFRSSREVTRQNNHTTPSGVGLSPMDRFLAERKHDVSVQARLAAQAERNQNAAWKEAKEGGFN